MWNYWKLKGELIEGMKVTSKYWNNCWDSYETQVMATTKQYTYIWDSSATTDTGILNGIHDRATRLINIKSVTESISTTGQHAFCLIPISSLPYWYYNGVCTGWTRLLSSHASFFYYYTYYTLDTIPSRSKNCLSLSVISVIMANTMVLFLSPRPNKQNIRELLFRFCFWIAIIYEHIRVSHVYISY